MGRRFVVLAVLSSLLALSPVAAQSAGDEWSGTVSDEDLASNEVLNDSFVSIVRLDDGTFLGTAFEDYVSNPGTCGEHFFRRYEGVGTLSPGGETLSFEGTLSGVISSTCGESVREIGGEASFTVAVADGNISGYFGVGFVDLNGPEVAPPAPLFTVEDGVLRITTPPGEVVNIARGDLPTWAGAQIAVVGAMISHSGPPDRVATGDAAVLLDGLPIARVGDTTVRAGSIQTGSDQIFVNGVPVAVVGSATVSPTATGVVLDGPGVIVLPSTGLHPSLVSAGCTVCADVTEEMAEETWTPEQRALLEEFLQGARATSADARAGDTRLEIDSSFVEVGDGITIGSGEGPLEFAIAAGEGSILLDRPLEFDHPAGTLVTRLSPDNLDLVPSLDDSVTETSDPATTDAEPENPTAAIPDTDDVSSASDGSPSGSAVPVAVAVIAVAAAGAAGLWWRRRGSRST